MPSTRRRPRRPDGSVGGHFLESAAARTLDTRHIRRMSEDEAIEMFVQSRWKERGGKPRCPHKGCEADRVYRMTVNRKLKSGIKKVLIFKCAACRRQFSPTSGTPFRHHKLELRDYLYATALFVTGAKGRAALDMCAVLDVQAKTMFVIQHKMREALMTLVRTAPLSGQVEIDTAGFGGKRRKKNLVKERRHSMTVPEERQAVAVIKQRKGETRAFVVPREVDAIEEIMKNLAPDAHVFGDDTDAWNPIELKFKMSRINHSKYGYASAEANTNQAESFFSRMRRAAIGIHHRLAGKHLTPYAVEMAWRETNNRIGSQERFDLLLDAISHSPPSVRWSNYWGL